MTDTEILQVVRLLMDRLPDAKVTSPDDEVQDLIDLAHEIKGGSI